MVGHFRKSHRDKSSFSISVDFTNSCFTISEIGDATRNHPIRVFGIPLGKEPVIPCPHSIYTYLSISGFSEYRSTKTSDLGWEIKHRPDPAKIHIFYSRINVVTTRPHLVKAKRFQRYSFRLATCYRVHPNLTIGITFKFPDLMTLFSFN